MVAENNYKVYAHTNKSNGKVYIGVTGQDASKRWNNGHGYKGCVMFSRAIEKYGWDGFDHIILKDGLTRDEAAELERQLISEYDSTNPKVGYNCALGGFASGSMSDATKEKIRVANIGKKYSDETRLKHSIAVRSRGSIFNDLARINARLARSKPICQYDANKSAIKMWESVNEAAITLGLPHQNISRCLCGKSHTCGGFYWSYADSNIVEPQISTKTEVAQIDIASGFVVRTYDGLQDASLATGISKGNISAVCHGRRRSAGGFGWSFHPTDNEEKENNNG